VGNRLPALTVTLPRAPDQHPHVVADGPPARRAVHRGRLDEMTEVQRTQLFRDPAVVEPSIEL